VKEMLLFSGNHDTDKKSRFPFAWLLQKGNNRVQSREN
jgi:hypothetical protein